ncbi:MAG: DUF434 domain-containing protein [Methanobacteriaceae archaeon]
MNFKDPGLEAANRDFRYLLNQGYPRKGALKFVGDHYLLKDTSRNYLYRTVFSNEQADNRKMKLVVLSDIKNKIVFVDGYNVLITLESICSGENGLIVKGDDGVIRDVKAVFGKYKGNKMTKSVLNSVMSLLKPYHPLAVRIFYDRQISLSGELAKLTREIMAMHGVQGTAETSENVDFQLVHLSRDLEGIVATSDGVIMDKVEKILDIPSYVSKIIKK